MARDLDAILTFLGPCPVILVGHSIGGMIILTLCRLFPDTLGRRVSGMVLAHTTYTNPVRTTAKHRLATALQKPVLEPLLHLAIWLSPVLWLLNVLSYLNGSAHRSTARQSFAGTQTRQQVEFVTRCVLHTSPAVLARGMLGMLRYDATATLPTIGVPVLIVAGDQDTTTLPDASTFMQAAIPDAQLTTLAPAKHQGLLEHHAQFAQRVAAFCDACLRPGERRRHDTGKETQDNPLTAIAGASGLASRCGPMGPTARRVCRSYTACDGRGDVCAEPATATRPGNAAGEATMRTRLREKGLSLVMFGLFCCACWAIVWPAMLATMTTSRPISTLPSPLRPLSRAAIVGRPRVKTGRANFCRWPPTSSVTVFLFQRGSAESKDPDSRRRGGRGPPPPSTRSAGPGTSAHGRAAR